MMSEVENLDVILGSSNVNQFYRELSNVIGNPESHCVFESNSQPREDDSRENVFEHYVHENVFPRQDRFQETMETVVLTCDMRIIAKLVQKS